MRLSLLLCWLFLPTVPALAQRPNVVLLMADDLGYGDLGCQGHPHLHTPHLDAMAADGIRLSRFHAAAPVCSPTRASVLTGRHPLRCGIPFANSGHLREDQPTLQQLLRANGYRTGFFGKWHLGTLTTTVRDSNRGGPEHKEHFAPPWLRGFDRCFATEAKVPTFDPMRDPVTGEPFGTLYWNEAGEIVDDGLDGDDSRVIVDRVLPFLADCKQREQPFLAVVWFHAPHLPVVASAADRARYAEFDEATQHYYGCITALDREVGRLRAELRQLGLHDDTIVWFCSDNGPEGAAGKAPGSAGKLRGRKRSLYEGGTRVPGIVVWPRRIRAGASIDLLAHTGDLLPTLAGWLGIDLPEDPRRDGIDLGRALVEMSRGAPCLRARGIGFESQRMACWTEQRLKLVSHLGKDGELPAVERVELFDLYTDPRERHDVAADHPDDVQRMQKLLDDWRLRVRER